MHVSSCVLLTAAIFTAVTALLVLGCVVLVFVYRRDRVIHNSSPLFCLITLSGGVMLVVSAFLMTVRNTPALCIVEPWLQHCGFMIGFGSLFVKVRTGRLVGYYTGIMT